MSPKKDEVLVGRSCKSKEASDSSGLSVSRRDFFKTVSIAGIATGVISPGVTRAQEGVRAVGPNSVPVELMINGQRHRLTIEPRVTLLDAARNQLDITGAKRVCDRGSCGACTMMVDGRAVYSCSTLAIEVQGKEIRTVEGLADADGLHPVQQAFCDTDGLMCGFCTPGYVVAAVSMLEKTPNPTPEEARVGLDGNICRCGTYARVLEATLKAQGVRRG